MIRLSLDVNVGSTSQTPKKEEVCLPKQTFQKGSLRLVNTNKLLLVRGDDVIGGCGSEAPPSLRCKSSPVHFLYSVCRGKNMNTLERCSIVQTEAVK